MACKAMVMLRVNSVWGINSSSSHESRLPPSARFAPLSRCSFGCSRRIPSPFSFGPLKGSRITSCCSDAQPSSPSTSIDVLRRQLEALHLEAEQARGRANAARARFMRLTETVENLRTRAITDLKSGKEGSARQLIAEKQKVMQALEKSKQRAELLEELCNKLGEVISSKELQVMASLSSTVGVDESSKTTLNVRIVSPKVENLSSDGVANMEKTGDAEKDDLIDSKDSLNNQNGKALRPHIGADEDAMKTDDPSTDTVNAVLSSRVKMYPDFLSGIDNRLHEAEVQLHGFLNIAAMVVPEDVDKITKEKVNVVRQIWQDVLLARARIRKVVQQEDIG